MSSESKSDLVAEYQRLLEQAEVCKSEMDRAQGAADAVLKTLKVEFGVDSISDAELLLKELEQKEEDLREVYVARRDAFKSQLEEYNQALIVER